VLQPLEPPPALADALAEADPELEELELDDDGLWASATADTASARPASARTAPTHLPPLIPPRIYHCAGENATDSGP